MGAGVQGRATLKPLVAAPLQPPLEPARTAAGSTLHTAVEGAGPHAPRAAAGIPPGAQAPPALGTAGTPLELAQQARPRTAPPAARGTARDTDAGSPGAGSRTGPAAAVAQAAAAAAHSRRRMGWAQPPGRGDAPAGIRTRCHSKPSPKGRVGPAVPRPAAAGAARVPPARIPGSAARAGRIPGTAVPHRDAEGHSFPMSAGTPRQF
mmetsp:Transcript_34917/g.110300  ORF Transcript_34917/g.110300 Transcript_34917/m.110300 type:complete len:207 (+) Transcript_34917:1657-2277(+)